LKTLPNKQGFKKYAIEKLRLAGVFSFPGITHMGRIAATQGNYREQM